MTLIATPKTLNPTDPEHLDFLHRKLLYALDERPVFWWKKGTKYGVVNGEAKPMWGMWVFFVQRVVEHRAESFDVASLEAVYMTDLETGELLDEYYIHRRDFTRTRSPHGARNSDFYERWQ